MRAKSMDHSNSVTGARHRLTQRFVLGNRPLQPLAAGRVRRLVQLRVHEAALGPAGRALNDLLRSAVK